MASKSTKLTPKTLCDGSKFNTIKMFYKISINFNEQMQISTQINGRKRKAFCH